MTWSVTGVRHETDSGLRRGRIHRRLRLLLYPLNNLAWHLRLSAVTEIPSPMMQMMIHPWMASSEKLVAETGYRFRHDTRTAFEDFARSVISANHGRQ